MSKIEPVLRKLETGQDFVTKSVYNSSDLYQTGTLVNGNPIIKNVTDNCCRLTQTIEPLNKTNPDTSVNISQPVSSQITTQSVSTPLAVWQTDKSLHQSTTTKRKAKRPTVKAIKKKKFNIFM